MKNTTILLLSLLLGCYSCAHKGQKKETLDTTRPQITVSIPPLKYIVERISGDDFDINTIVPNGTSPETYTINPLQSEHIEQSDLIFVTGLFEIEHNILENKDRNNHVINLSEHIDLIADKHHIHPHSYLGADPHIWLAPAELSVITQNALNALMRHYPDSVKYQQNAELLLDDIKALHTDIANKLTTSATKAFMVYHPALSYFAREFSLEQISVEYEGKEPSANTLSSAINEAKQQGVKHIMIQNEFPTATATSIAKDMNADIVEINPLSENVLQELLFVTNVITE